MSAVIRRATSGDWPAVSDFLCDAGLPRDDLEPADMQDFFVAVRATGEPLGAIGFERYGTHGLLRSLVVAEGARGAGLGRALVTRLEREAAAAGVTELWLLTIDADRFFTGRGYAAAARDQAPAAIRRTAEFSRLCPASARLMRRRIG